MMITATDIAERYHAYKTTHGITARTQWVIGRAMLPYVRQARDGMGVQLYFDVITPRALHYTLMGLSFELSDADPNALFLTEI